PRTRCCRTSTSSSADPDAFPDQNNEFPAVSEDGYSPSHGRTSPIRAGAGDVAVRVRRSGAGAVGAVCRTLAQRTGGAAFRALPARGRTDPRMGASAARLRGGADGTRDPELPRVACPTTRAARACRRRARDGEAQPDRARTALARWLHHARTGGSQ